MVPTWDKHSLSQATRAFRATAIWLSLAVALTLAAVALFGGSPTAWADEPQERLVEPILAPSTEPRTSLEPLDESPEPLAGTWALTSMSLVILGLLLALLLLLLALRRPVEATDTPAEVPGGQPNSRALPLALTSLALAVVSGAFFLYSSELSGLMVAIDTWTPLHAATLAIQLLLALAARRQTSSSQEPVA